jgi:hypothetical protein
MDFWPDFIIGGKKFEFPHIKCCDNFAFYQFILDKSSNKRYSSSLCSVPYVSLSLGKTRMDIESALADWCERRKTLKGEPPHSEKLSMPLIPGQIYSYGKSYEWNKVARPFYHFLLDAANQSIGTIDDKLLEVASIRVPNIVRLNFSGYRKDDSDKPVNDFFNNKPGGDEGLTYLRLPQQPTIIV